MHPACLVLSLVAPKPFQHVSVLIRPLTSHRWSRCAKLGRIRGSVRSSSEAVGPTGAGFTEPSLHTRIRSGRNPLLGATHLSLFSSLPPAEKLNQKGRQELTRTRRRQHVPGSLDFIKPAEDDVQPEEEERDGSDRVSHDDHHGN